jgi:hypothetical protein
MDKPDDPIYDYVRTVMLEIMAVLWSNGQKQLHVGAMMRLIGVEESQAAKHDDERIDIDESFEEMAADHHVQHLLKNQMPAGTSLH